MFSTILVIIFFLIALNNTYLIYVYRKKNIEASNYIKEIGQHIAFVYAKIKQLDKKQMFEKDEELGIIFSAMKDLVEKLYIINTGDFDAKEKEKK